MALRLQRFGAERVANGQGRQADLAVLQVGVGIIGPLHVGPQEPGKRDHPAARSELGVLAGGRTSAQANRHALPDGIRHLGGYGPHPHQFVQAALVAVQTRAPRAVRKVSPAGRMASCASWAFLTFLSYRRGRAGTYSAPYRAVACERAARNASSESVVESVRM